MVKMFRGACLCGAVQFSYTAPSLWCAHCHCSMCQRGHGAGVVTWVGVPEKQFHLDRGEQLQWYASSAQAQRGFCGDCGSSLFFRSSRWPGEVHIARANLEGEIDRKPAAHVYWDTHVDWLDLAEDELPHVVAEG